MIRILVSLLTLSNVLSLFAQSTTRDEVSDKIALQQAQIDQLRATINEQKHTLDKVLQLLEAKSAASPAAEHPAAAPVQPAPIGANPKASAVSGESPMTVHAGNLEITPGGFLDSAVVIRSTNIGSGLGTSFGGMPYPNTPAGQLSEVKFSAQNSRLSLRLKGNFGQTDLLGYLETDFLGNQPANGVVSSNSNGLRLRLAFVDLRHGKWEILGGQAYSFLTPNRIGISSMPRDMFLTLDVDPNFHVGLTWTRAPQFRFAYHPNQHWAAGVAIENPEQYIGGAVTLPAALSTSYAPQLDNGSLSNASSVPNLHPDIIPKIVFDGGAENHPVHLEAVGLVRTFRVFNQSTGAHESAQGYGASANGNVAVTKALRLLVNTYWSDGGGRYIFGLGPDLIIRPDGTPSPVKSASGIAGIEIQATPRVQIYGYYGTAYFARNYGVDGAGKLSGFGFTGSASSANREIEQATAGLVRTIWKDNRFGTLLVNSQYSYLTRSPWFVAPGQPGNAHAHQVYVDLRYVMP